MAAFSREVGLARPPFSEADGRSAAPLAAPERFPVPPCQRGRCSAQEEALRVRPSPLSVWLGAPQTRGRTDIRVGLVHCGIKWFRSDRHDPLVVPTRMSKRVPTLHARLFFLLWHRAAPPVSTLFNVRGGRPRPLARPTWLAWTGLSSCRDARVQSRRYSSAQEHLS